MEDKIWEYLESMSDEDGRISNSESAEVIAGMLTDWGYKFNMVQEMFDGGPGYTAIHYVFAWIEPEAELKMVDYLVEWC